MLENTEISATNVRFAPGLPPTGSWQDLKDHMREAGDVCYADVYKDGTGVVEFLRYEDMKYAAKKLDDSKFRSHEVSSCLTHNYIVSGLDKQSVSVICIFTTNLCLFFTCFCF